MISNPIPAFIEMMREKGEWLDCEVVHDREENRMDDRHIKLKDAIEVVRETVEDKYIKSSLELRLLDKSLTGDVVEVVRCKDCKYHYSWKDVDDCFYHACERWGDNLGYDADVDVNYFCSFGERAEK